MFRSFAFLAFSVLCFGQSAVIRDGCAAAGASATTYTCSYTVSPTLITGHLYWFKADVANSGAATINFNSLGAKTVKKLNGNITTDLVANDLVAGQWVALFYDGTNMQMASQLGNGPSVALFNTQANCSSAATPAVCGAAPTGAVAIPTGVTSVTLVVNTTAVTANSRIFLVSDDSVTIAATTCNSTLATLVGGLAVTARTAATSFTITYNGTIATNPLCVSYLIID